MKDNKNLDINGDNVAVDSNNFVQGNLNTVTVNSNEKYLDKATRLIKEYENALLLYNAGLISKEECDSKKQEARDALGYEP